MAASAHNAFKFDPVADTIRLPKYTLDYDANLFSASATDRPRQFGRAEMARARLEFARQRTCSFYVAGGPFWRRHVKLYGETGNLRWIKSAVPIIDTKVLCFVRR
jgi:hypothetical protein